MSNPVGLYTDPSGNTLHGDGRAALPPVRSEPLFGSWEDFASFLVNYGIVDRAAVEDPEGYDNCDTVEFIEDAFNHLPNVPPELRHSDGVKLRAVVGGGEKQ